MTQLVLASLPELPPEEAASAVACLVEALVQVNLIYLKSTRGVPLLHASGVRYEEDAPWQDVPALLLSRRGDCKSLAAWRIAELRAQGKSALVHVVYVPREEEDLFHVQVRRGSRIEDPSRFLGMRS